MASGWILSYCIGDQNFSTNMAASLRVFCFTFKTSRKSLLFEKGPLGLLLTGPLEAKVPYIYGVTLNTSGPCLEEPLTWQVDVRERDTSTRVDSVSVSSIFVCRREP